MVKTKPNSVHNGDDRVDVSGVRTYPDPVHNEDETRKDPTITVQLIEDYRGQKHIGKTKKEINRQLILHVQHFITQYMYGAHFNGLDSICNTIDNS